MLIITNQNIEYLRTDLLNIIYRQYLHYKTINTSMTGDENPTVPQPGTVEGNLYIIVIP